MFSFAQARVTAHKPPNKLQVVFKSMGQMPATEVVLLHDYADAVRVRQKPLPQIGSWGVVIFPYGDIRNGIWLGAYLPSLMDALTTTQASGFAQTDPFLDYEAAFSGDWWLHDGLGNRAHQYADSSYFIAGSGTTLPTLYRHTVDAKNNQQTIPYPYTDRTKNSPVSGSAFYYHFQHKSGTSFEINPSGSVTVSGAAGASLTMKFGGATLTINSAGLATLDLPGSETFNITQGGAAASDFLVLVSKFVTAFNNHKHLGVTAGGGQTGTPVTNLTANDVKSVVVDISG